MAQEAGSMNDGCAIPQLGLVVDAHTTTRDVENALDAGVAHIYLNTSHAHMDAVGGALQDRPRERVFVTVAWSGNGGISAVETDLRTSLQWLSLSHVDLYLLPSSAASWDAWVAMEHARDAGLVRSIGVSGFDPDSLAQLLASARHPPTVNQLDFVELSTRRLETLQFCAERNITVATIYSLKLLAPQVRTVVNVIAECEEVAPETVLLAWARAKGGVVLVTQVPSSEDFTLSAADAVSIDEAASGERDAGFVRETDPDAISAPVVPTADAAHPPARERDEGFVRETDPDGTSPPAVPMADAPQERDEGFVRDTDPGVPTAPSVPTAAASHLSALGAGGRDQIGEYAAPPPYSAAAPIFPSPTSARPPRFDRLGVVELGHILTPEELVAWWEMDRRRFRWYRFCTRTVLFAIWVYLVPNGMYQHFLHWLQLEKGRA